MKGEFYDTQSRQEYYSEDQIQEAFEAGRSFGRDEMNTNVMKYPHEIKTPNFKEWFENEKD